MAVRFRISEIVRQQKGSVLAIAAVGMPVLIGAAGLATDTIQWTLWKSQLQRTADSAALAGAFAKAQEKSAIAGANLDLQRNNTLPLLSPATIENMPSSGAYAGDKMAVRVRLQTQRDLPFSSLFMLRAPLISVEATATSVNNGDYCLIALERNAVTGIRMQGNSTVEMGCGMATNAAGAVAVEAGGSSVVKSTPLAAVGGIPNSNNFAVPTTLLPYSVPQRDPFADLPDPVLPSPCNNDGSVKPQENKTLKPGCYKGMDLKGTVTLEPGIYYIDGKSFGVGSQARVTGLGVTIVLTSSVASTNPKSIATVDINGGATLKLEAGTQAPYSGILFYQDRRAKDEGTNKINGNAQSTFKGSIYLPSQEVEFTGTAGMVTDCIQLVSRRVLFSGNSKISNTCPPDPNGPAAFQGTRVLLVG